MDLVLSHYLPEELVDRISREVHVLNFKPCLYSIKYNLVWIRSNNKYSFMIGNGGGGGYNSFLFLDSEWITIHSKRYLKNREREIKQHNASYSEDGYFCIGE